MSGLDDDSLGLLRDSTAELVSRVVLPGARTWDERGCLASSVARAMGELGLLALGAPEARGGVAADPRVVVPVLEVLARGDGSLALAVATHALAVACCGERSQERHLLDTWLSWAPSAGTCQALPDGDGWTLQGPDVALVMADQAEAAVLEARDGDVRATFLVPREDLQAALGPRCALGMRAASIRQLRLSGLRVGKAARLDPEGEPPFEHARSFVAAIALGLGRVALDDAVAYARSRVQFGEPIAALQAIQVKLASMATGLEASAALVARATGAPSSSGGPATAARLFGAREAVRVCSESLQIHGGVGYTCDLPAERRLRDARWCIQAWWSPAAEREAIVARLRSPA